MFLRRLDIYHVRNIRQQTLYPAKTFNFIYGKNGSGKSALIEAIFLLGRAKSFRTPSIKQVINFEESELIVSAQIQSDVMLPVNLGVRMGKNDFEIHRNQQSNLKRSDLALTLPLQIIHPKSYELLDAGAQIRREFLDWGVFNQDAEFHVVWKSYKKILAQRNALLKSHNLRQIRAWDKELADYGNRVHLYRETYVSSLTLILIKTISFFLPFSDISIKLLPGWNNQVTLHECLDADFDRDVRDGFTHSGPHRGDFHLLISNRLAKEAVSRGQLKLLVICLKLAQVVLLNSHRENFGCILIDDFSAELDWENRNKLLSFLQTLDCQIFITATERNDFGDLSIIDDYKMFHVEQGEFN